MSVARAGYPVSKVLKGQENMTFETIDKLEQALGIELVKVVEA